MSRLKNISLSLLFILIAYPIGAQTVIKGVVIDAETGKPLPGANVYLANTTIGAGTDSTGYYKIELSFSGVHNLVFSFVGYKKKIVPLKISPSSTLTIDAELKPEPIQLDEIAVTGSNELWEERLSKFKEEFIGSTDFAEKTTITNPQVLRFEVDQKTDQLLASSIKPIIVINNSLGYKIYLELDQFKWSLHGVKGLYLIYPKFEPIITDNKQLQKRWEENRRETYEGSFKHFLRSLYHDKIRTNNFDISSFWKLEALTNAERTFQLLGKAPPKLVNKLKGYKLIKPVVVAYGRFEHQKVQSYIAPNTRRKTFFVDKYGNLLNPATIRAGGHWERMRLANALPQNYMPNR